MALRSHSCHSPTTANNIRKCTIFQAVIPQPACACMVEQGEWQSSLLQWQEAALLQWNSGASQFGAHLVVYGLLQAGS